MFALMPCLLFGNAQAEWNSEIGIEGRWFWQDALDPVQEDTNLSLHLQSEYYSSWDGGDQSFVLCISPAPGAALHFQEMSEGRILNSIEIDIELCTLKQHSPAQAILLYHHFFVRDEILSVKPQAVCGRCDVATSR